MNPHGLDPATLARLRAMQETTAPAKGAVPAVGAGQSVAPPEALPSDPGPLPPMPSVVPPSGPRSADPEYRQWIRDGLIAQDFGLAAMDPVAELRRIDEERERKRLAEIYAKREAAMNAGELMVVEDRSGSDLPFVIAEGSGGKGYLVPGYGPHEMEPLEILEDGRHSEATPTDTPFLLLQDALGNRYVMPDYGPYRGQTMLIGDEDRLEEALADLKGSEAAPEAVAVVARR